MALVRWEPLRDLMGFQERMNRLFDDVYSRRGELSPIQKGDWSPAVDVFETKDAVELRAELPGMSASDVDISLENDVLTLSGERTMSKEVKEENYHRVERSYGSFTRSFALPMRIHKEKIKATFKDGVLHVTLPKAEEAKPKQIKIEVADK
ncbi:MAG: Hsp20/alpha crystallin family protein [Candidatus Coatesbacteria bacterium]|nr:Hsp20/alpha crystallin family protein [Candidatus Coatesbacteria bacterium]